MRPAQAQPVTTVAALLHAARAQLDTLESARLDAEVLLCSVLAVDRAHCIAHPEQPVAPAVAADFRNLVARRREGYPLAYLTGQREFWSLEIAVNRYTLIPRPETELIVEIARDLARQLPAQDVLELGTGSGAVCSALARECPGARITATDVCRQALALAQQNAQQHGIDTVTFLLSDWYAELGARRFDLILSNPPYVDTASPALREAPLRYEPRLALDGGRAGLESLARIIAGAGRHLRAGAHLVLEHGFDQGESVRALMSRHGLAEVRTYPDLASQDRVTVGRWT
jgi:release factor glutamine methyltransferase